MKKALSFGLCLALFMTVFATAAMANDKPRIAVLEIKNKADNQYWWHGGGEAMQDVFVTELVKSGKFRVIDREQLATLMREKNLSLSGDIDPKTAIRAGKLLGVQYFLTGAVTEYGVTDRSGHAPSIGKLPSFSVGKRQFVAAANARLIDAETGEILWADEGRGEAKSGRLRVGGFGGSKDDRRMFDKVMKPIIGELVASLKAADI